MHSTPSGSGTSIPPAASADLDARSECRIGILGSPTWLIILELCSLRHSGNSPIGAFFTAVMGNHGVVRITANERRNTMKTIVSALIALSVLAGIAAPAS